MFLHDLIGDTIENRPLQYATKQAIARVKCY